MTEHGHRLVLAAHRWDQFVFLIAEDDPMRCPRLDHWGQAVTTLAELEESYARAQAYAQRDDRVDLIAPTVEDHPGVRLHSWYVRFRLPMMVETQFFDWQA